MKCQKVFQLGIWKYCQQQFAQTWNLHSTFCEFILRYDIQSGGFFSSLERKSSPTINVWKLRKSDLNRAHISNMQCFDKAQKSFGWWLCTFWIVFWPFPKLCQAKQQECFEFHFYFCHLPTFCQAKHSNFLPFWLSVKLWFFVWKSSEVYSNIFFFFL